MTPVRPEYKRRNFLFGTGRSPSVPPSPLPSPLTHAGVKSPQQVGIVSLRPTVAPGFREIDGRTYDFHNIDILLTITTPAYLARSHAPHIWPVPDERVVQWWPVRGVGVGGNKGVWLFFPFITRSVYNRGRRVIFIGVRKINMTNKRGSMKKKLS